MDEWLRQVFAEHPEFKWLWVAVFGAISLAILSKYFTLPRHDPKDYE